MQSTFNSSDTQPGFTLIELMVTLTIVAILMAIAVPSMRAFVDRTTVSNASRELVLDLATAKSEAVTRQESVRVVPEVGNDWTSGWRVIEVDGLGNEVEEIRTHDALPARIELTSVEFAAGVVPEFQDTGRATTPGTFHVQLDDCQQDEAFDININLMGRTNTTGAACQ